MKSGDQGTFPDTVSDAAVEVSRSRGRRGRASAACEALRDALRGQEGA
jgi:hypothetical protein